MEGRKRRASIIQSHLHSLGIRLLERAGTDSELRDDGDLKVRGHGGGGKGRGGSHETTAALANAVTSFNLKRPRGGSSIALARASEEDVAEVSGNSW